jgi:peptidoglycan/LPS O-acetylase OafA/YrhL
MYISEEHFERKNNNFDAMRLLGAISVFISHGHGFTNKEAEPLYALTGRYYVGKLGLFIFFTLSGFLISRSLTRSSVKDFLWNRFLRICPGIAVCSLLTILVTGCIFTTLPVKEFLLHFQTWYFLIQNSFPVRIIFTLPGVFDGKGVNASLWTIPVDIRMYGILLMAYLLRLFTKRWLIVCGWILLIIAYLFFTKLLMNISGLKNLYSLFYVGTWFIGGAVFYLYRDKVPVRFSIWILLLVLWLATWKFFPYYLSISEMLFFIYTIILAGVSKIHIPFPKADISYGFYLYAFPIQQSIYHAWGDQLSPWQFHAISFSTTLIFGIASWFLVEKKALTLKKHRGVVLTEKLIAQPEDEAHQYKQ